MCVHSKEVKEWLRAQGLSGQSLNSMHGVEAIKKMTANILQNISLSDDFLAQATFAFHHQSFTIRCNMKEIENLVKEKGTVEMDYASSGQPMRRLISEQHWAALKEEEDIPTQTEQGSYIHMHILGKSVSPLNDFVEGNVYDYKGCDFPRNMYRLQPFESLNTLDANVLVDAIGRVVEIYSPLEKVINGRPSRLIDFLIEDLKGNQVKCTVWDDHVEKVKPSFRSDLLDPVVVLIQMGRIKLVEKSGEVKICSSYDATNLLFNQNTVEFVLCMQQQTPLKSITSNSTFSYGTTSGGDLSSSKMQITTLSKIFSKRETGDIWVPCKIIGIESDPNDWYYDSFPQQNCNKKLEFKSELYDCGKCGGRFIKGNIRYKLKIRVVDVNGTTPLLLWDRQVLELLCVKADESKAMQPSVMTKIPKDIRNLKGRGLFFKLAVRSDQFDNLNNEVPVMQVNHFPEMFENYCHGLIKHNDDEFCSKLQLTEDDSDSYEVFMFFFSADPTESPIGTASGKQNVAVNETE
nr:replication protein A 70 kDa DNA-binding subunit D-like [Ipomoea batatas]